MEDGGEKNNHEMAASRETARNINRCIGNTRVTGGLQSFSERNSFVSNK